MTRTLHVIGTMSGSSLDGLDMALCRFELAPLAAAPLKEWELLATHTVPFSPDWCARLRRLPAASGRELAAAHVDFGHYLGALLRPFIAKISVPLDCIASHGHTIFHYPEQRLTLQLGDGAALAAATGQVVIDNLRAMDVALGGQGAPLAPLADKLLLPGFDFYLNLGGIANISARVGDRQIAFDISGANQVLDALAQTLGHPYDEGGRLAASGRLRPALLAAANELPYFSRQYPKSLGNDWVQEQLLPRYRHFEAPASDKLHTACVQLGQLTARAIEQIIEREQLAQPSYRMLVTGGGAFNDFLVDCIRAECEKSCSLAVIIPDPQQVAFKEAALIALMGALRLIERPNCLATATGARFDAVGGAVHYGIAQSAD